jgi:hypothetical protein
MPEFLLVIQMQPVQITIKFNSQLIPFLSGCVAMSFGLGYP